MHELHWLTIVVPITKEEFIYLKTYLPNTSSANETISETSAK